MKRTFLFLACFATLLLGACTSESSLPNPTGKGAIRAINGISGSPEVRFLIEERALSGVTYKNSTAPVSFDDFDYIFNFEITKAGDTEATRFASVPLKVERDRQHILALTGDFDNPTVTTWVGDTRQWDGSETVFEARFAHLAESLGDIDVYFADSTMAPIPGNQVATLAFGEIMDPRDFEEGPYVITVTAAGDVNTVYYTSYEETLLPRYAHVISIFDGDENDTAPIFANTMTAVGNPLAWPDSSSTPSIRFVHAAYSLETVDVYDDDVLTSQVASGIEFGAATPDIPVTAEPTTYYFTPANSTATVLFQQDVGTPQVGRQRNSYLTGATDDWSAVTLSQDRASSLTAVKFTIYHSAVNYDFFDVYIMQRDVAIGEDDRASLFGVPYGFPSPTLQLAAGSYDIYATANGEKTEIAGPFQLDVVLGDVVNVIAVDTADPAVIEIRDASIP